MRAARQNETATINLDHIGQGSWFDIFEPEAACFTDERFGSKTRTGRYGAVGDGPKFLCGVDHLANKAARLAEKGADERCLVYSIGSNNDVSFERAVHDFMPGCEVHTFDPTLRKAFVGDEYATFHDWGLGKDGESAAHRGKSWTAKGLETIMQELGHTNRTIDILKVDCEGCEYETLPPVFDAMVAGNVQIGQLQVEMHIGGRGVRDIHDFFAAADRATLRIFHKERNHWGCAGYKCVKYAFASESFLREANAAAICPAPAGERNNNEQQRTTTNNNEQQAESNENSPTATKTTNKLPIARTEEMFNPSITIEQYAAMPPALPTHDWLLNCSSALGKDTSIVRPWIVARQNYALGDCIKLCRGCRRYDKVTNLTMAHAYSEIACQGQDQSKSDLDKVQQVFELFEQNKHYGVLEKPDADAIVIHLRLGDVVELSNGNVQTMLVEGAQGAHSCCQNKKNMSIRSFYEYFDTINNSTEWNGQKITNDKIVIVGGSHKRAYYRKSKVYAHCLQRALARAGKQVEMLLNKYLPDQDFYYVSHAKRMMVSTGGYSRLMGNMAVKNGGKKLGSAF